MVTPPQAEGLKKFDSIAKRAEDLSLHLSVYIGSGFHPSSESIGADGYSAKVKRPVRETKHPSSSRVDFKNEWTFTDHPPFDFMLYTRRFSIPRITFR